MAKQVKKVSPAALLAEIDKIFKNAKYYQSRESGKRFYESDEFSGLLSNYILQSGLKLKEHAKKFGMSVGTLKAMLAKGRLSDNMLGRIRSSLGRDVSDQKEKIVFEGDWHSATSKEVAAAISDVSQKLVFLKKVIEASNFVHSRESPIDQIQVAQLIALLASMIEALRAPLVDKKQAQGFFKWLGKITKTSVEKGVERVLTDAMHDAVRGGVDLVQHLSAEAGIPDLGDIVG